MVAVFARVVACWRLLVGVCVLNAFHLKIKKKPSLLVELDYLRRYRLGSRRLKIIVRLTDTVFRTWSDEFSEFRLGEAGNRQGRP